MRLVKMLGLAALAALATMAFVGAPSASATTTKLCDTHTGLSCETQGGLGLNHQTLATGTVWKLLSSLVNVLCLGALVESEGLGLGSPQVIHGTTMSFSGCGTGSAHTNCTVTVEELPLVDLLKTGLDEGVLTALNGRIRVACSNLSLNCVYDTEGVEFAVGASHLTAEKAPAVELSGKFFCPKEGFIDGLLETLTNAYVLG